MPGNINYKKEMSNNIRPNDRNLDLFQTVKVNIMNNTRYAIPLVQKILEEGVWSHQPANIIAAHESNSFISKVTLLGGIKGIVEYSIIRGNFKFYWRLPVLGSISHEFSVMDPADLYDISLADDRDTFTITVDQKRDPQG